MMRALTSRTNRPPSGRSTRLRHVVSAMLALVLGAAVLPVIAAPASADLPDQLTFDGRGWGHGRGMSQYGAQGYATSYGWNRAQILDHYYGGTRAGSAASATSPAGSPNPDYMRVRLMRMSGQPTRVTIGNGALTFSQLGVYVSPTRRTAFLNPTSNGFDVWVSDESSCTVGLTYAGTTTSQLVDIGKNRPDSADPNDMIRVCPAAGTTTSYWYPGSIRAQLVNGRSETMNITTMEKQLRSIVPSESLSSWAPAALQAQAVSARSYTLAGDSRYPGADTCDTIYCQVYKGHFWDGTGPVTATTHPNTDAAIAATANEVRLTSSNRIARTEFSSTSGGWTAGGTFPAVEDKGDAISPRSSWTCTVSIRPLETSYGGGSSLTGFRVTSRNGLGAFGGRVLAVQLTFANGSSTTRTGNEIRSALSSGTCTDRLGRTFSSGLLSDWFTDSCSTDARYIDAAYGVFLGRRADSGGTAYWCDVIKSKGRVAFTTQLAVSDEWAGTQIADLYRRILGREPDGNGREYWRSQVARGLRIEEVATYFYGSEEYFARRGRTHGGFVDGLYRDLLGRNPDPQGRAYWVSELDRGRLSRVGVATNFYASIESRGSRVDGLYRSILGRGPDPDGRRYWSDQLLYIGDVSLASHLAASDEFYLRATR